MAEEKKVSKPGVGSRIARSFKNMRGEMKRVVWPNRRQVLNNTGIVLVFMVLSAVIVGSFDALLGLLTQLAFGI